MDAMTVKVDGLAGLLEALEELPKTATQKAVVRRSLILAAEPIRSLWAALAPYDASDQGLHLRDSVVVSAQTVSRQADPGAPPGSVTVYVGPAKNLPRHHGIFMEFGTFKDPPQPSGRPAFEGRKEESLNLLGYYMWVQIDASARRAAAKAARLAAL
jgi:HK97 gp10 family phage protein